MGKGGMNGLMDKFMKDNEKVIKCKALAILLAMMLENIKANG